jgi:hypothetical protein
MPTPSKKKPDVKKAPPKKTAPKGSSAPLKAQTPPKKTAAKPKKVVKAPYKRAASATPIYDSVVREKGFDPLGPKKKK